MRTLPALIHVRAAALGTPDGPSSREGERAIDEVSARTMNVDALCRDLQSGALPRDTEVLFTGIADWTAAHAVPELWVEGPARALPADDEPVSSIAESSRRATRAARRRNFGALAWVGAVFGALSLLAAALAAIYFAYFHYKPVAVQHLPRKCAVAMRVDVIDTFRFEPAKKGIPALYNALVRGPPTPPPPGPPPPAVPPLAERLKLQAGIDLDYGHVREIAVCAYADSKIVKKDTLLGWRGVIAIGGRIKAGVVPGLFEALRLEPALTGLGLRLEGTGPTAVIRARFGTVDLVLGQAEDGTLIVTTSEEALSAAREQRQEEEAHGSTGLVHPEASFELASGHFAFGLLHLVTPPKELATALPKLAKIQNGHLGLYFGKAPRAVIIVEPEKSSEAKGIEEALKELLEYTQTELTKSPTDWAGEHGAIGGAHLSREDLQVSLRLDFRLVDLDRGATELATQVDDAKSVLHTKTLPKLGLAPAPSASASASASASGSPSGPSTISPSAPPKLPKEDD